jgi:predicted RNase H-like HicB family nuclease
MNEQHLHYSMLIEWSEEDQAYLVTLPEWADRVMMPATHGRTYTEAVQHGQEVLEMLMNSALRDGEPLPHQKRTQRHSFILLYWLFGISVPLNVL